MHGFLKYGTVFTEKMQKLQKNTTIVLEKHEEHVILCEKMLFYVIYWRPSCQKCHFFKYSKKLKKTVNEQENVKTCSFT